MNIYYPSVELGASEERRERHWRVAAFIASTGVDIFPRPSLQGSNRLRWLQEADGVIVERANLSRQIERECRYTAQTLGKQVLIIMDHTTRQKSGEVRRQPSEGLRKIAVQSVANPDANLRIVDSGPTVKPVPTLAYVQSAIFVYLDARLNYRVPVGMPTTENRLRQEAEPFPDETEGRAYDEAYAAHLNSQQPEPLF